MSEDVSRRKMLSLLGLGAALGFTLSAALEPLEAEAQDRPLRTPLRPPPRSAQATGTHGMQRRTARARSHSPSATAHAPHRSTCCARRCTSSDAIAIRAGRTKQKGRGKPCSPRP